MHSDSSTGHICTSLTYWSSDPLLTDLFSEASCLGTGALRNEIRLSNTVNSEQVCALPTARRELGEGQRGGEGREGRGGGRGEGRRGEGQERRGGEKRGGEEGRGGGGTGEEGRGEEGRAEGERQERRGGAGGEGQVRPTQDNVTHTTGYRHTYISAYLQTCCR